MSSRRLFCILVFSLLASRVAFSEPICIPEDQFRNWMQQLSNIELQLSASQQNLQKAGKLNSDLKTESKMLNERLRQLRSHLSESRNTVQELGENLTRLELELKTLQTEFEAYKRKCENALRSKAIEKWLYAGGGLIIGVAVGYGINLVF